MARKTIANLNKRITFLKREKSKNSLGSTIDKFVNYKTVWANANETFGSEVYDAQRIEGNASYKFTVRYSSSVNRETINDGMMIRYRDQLFDIKDVNDVTESHDQLEIIAEVHLVSKGSDFNV